jgi:hypothetical protein
MTDNPGAVFTNLGVALSTWGQVEINLTGVFVQISEMKNVRKAIALFDGIINFELRLMILDRMMAHEAVDEVEREMWNRFSARLSKAYKKRHELAHFSLVGNQQHELCISPFLSIDKLYEAGDGHVKSLTARQIQVRGARFIELANGVHWFMSQAARRHGGA